VLRVDIRLQKGIKGVQPERPERASQLQSRETLLRRELGAKRRAPAPPHTTNKLRRARRRRWVRWAERAHRPQQLVERQPAARAARVAQAQLVRQVPAAVPLRQLREAEGPRDGRVARALVQPRGRLTKSIIPGGSLDTTRVGR
jgi:hypothetical protein